jgi:heat shock protein HtpX
MINVYEQVDRNKIRSALVMVFFVFFVTLAAWILVKSLGFGLQAVGWALIFAGFLSFASYWWSDKIILTISRARPADKKKDFQFFTVAENLALVANIPQPKLYVIEDDSPNAFATGRDINHAVVCVTTGLLSKLDRTELEGVVAHEISHIKNYDTRLMTIVSILVGMIVLLADWFLRGNFFRSRDRNEEGGEIGVIFFVLGIIFSLLSPLIAQLIQLAISRRREFLADASAVMLTRQPDGLVRALEKLANDNKTLMVANKATAHLFIVNPFKGRQAHDWLNNLFNTHPPIEERIKALKEMI